MARQRTDGPNETRVDGGSARREQFAANNFQSKNHGQEGPGVDGGVEGSGNKIDPKMLGYTGPVGELERNDDTRHPSSKIWVRRDRKPDAYLHTGGG